MFCSKNDIFGQMTYTSPPSSETLNDERISVGGRFSMPRVSTPRGKAEHDTIYKSLGLFIEIMNY